MTGFLSDLHYLRLVGSNKQLTVPVVVIILNVISNILFVNVLLILRLCVFHILTFKNHLFYTIYLFNFVYNIYVLMLFK